MGFDLDAYFKRIGYSGERAPTLATLAAIHVRHIARESESGCQIP